jgi:sterol 3beta-glucosyltransferase
LKEEDMRAVLTNFGSRGDTQPFFALADELRRCNHQPVLALSPYYASSAKYFGFDFIPVGPDLDLRKIMKMWVSYEDDQALINDLATILAPAFPQMFYDLREACRDADVLISGVLQPGSRMIHELTGIPYVTIRLYEFGGKYQLTYQQTVRSILNPFRAEYGLAPLDDPMNTDANSSQLVLYAMSRYFRPPQPDWPAHFHSLGFFFLSDEIWQPDPGLVEFLAAGAPPILVTLGSLVHHAPDELSQIVLEAIRPLKYRVIIQQGWSGLAQQSLPSFAYSIGDVPHDWLFPRIAAVVHHGGVGTTAAGLRAGVLAVIVPHVYDQLIWAEYMRDLKCTGPIIPYRQLTAERLRAAISTTLSDPSYRQNTVALSKKVRMEPGVQRAVRLIEQLVHQPGLSQTDHWLERLKEGQIRLSQQLRQRRQMILEQQGAY